MKKERAKGAVHHGRPSEEGKATGLTCIASRILFQRAGLPYLLASNSAGAEDIIVLPRSKRYDDEIGGVDVRRHDDKENDGDEGNGSYSIAVVIGVVIGAFGPKDADQQRRFAH